MVIQTVYMSLMAFFTYACMYGLRKPFTAAEFEGLSFLGIDFKALIIISQVLGYAISKFIGIKVISEMGRSARLKAVIILTGMAELSLLGFGLTPYPYNFIFLFFNGLPLGMIWGLVFAYLEGRRNTEILGTVLSISFIVSSGFVKSVGKIFMSSFGLSEFQMPWVTGLVFYIPLIVFMWLLDKSPNPTAADVSSRVKREPMNGAQRLALFKKFAPGIVLLTGAYILLTVYRDLRDSFAAEIWSSIGYANNSMIFTWSELPIAFVVLSAMAGLMLIKSNFKALMVNQYFILTGFLIIGVGTLLLEMGLINPLAWMILLGLGTYLGYLPYTSLLFDRMIAAFGTVANAGFLIYIADSFGYLGSVGILIFKNFSNKELSWFQFLTQSSFGLAITGSLLMLASIVYFRNKNHVEKSRLSGKKY